MPTSSVWIDRKPEVRTFEKWEAAWLSGVIDADGSIGLYDYGKEGRRVQIQVASVTEEFLRRVREVIGCGSQVNHLPSISHKGRQPMFNYSLKGSCRCYWVLKQIFPFLIVKRNKAAKIIKELEEKPFGRWAAATPEAKAAQSELVRSSWKDPVKRANRIRGMKQFYATRKK